MVERRGRDGYIEGTMRSDQTSMRSRSGLARGWRSITARTVGVLVFLLASACGVDPTANPTDATSPPTLDSTVIDGTDSSDPAGVVIAAADTGPDPDPTPLTYIAQPIYCCNPLTIDFVVEPAEIIAAGGATFDWAFGDSRTDIGAMVTHTFPWSGEFLVQLTVTWPDGRVDATERPLTVPLYHDDRVMASAGRDRVASSGDTVVLDGGASRGPLGGTLTYAWRQSAGPTVVLDGSEQPAARFVVPETYGEEARFVFTLTVTYEGLTHSDEVVVTVDAEMAETPIDGNRPPVLMDQTASVPIGEAATLTLSGSDADGDELTFVVVDSPVNASVQLVENAGTSATVLYTPSPGLFGTSVFSFQANDGVGASNVASFAVSACEPLNVIPWVELNYRSYDEAVIEGLQIWSAVGDTAIVSTRPGRSDLFAMLRLRIPQTRVIPGLKTTSLLDRFDSITGWQSVAREVSAIRQQSGERVILLENEEAIKAYFQGTETLDFDSFRAALAQLPGDTQYIWRPSVYWFAAGDAGHQRLVQVARVVEEVLPDVRFLDQRYISYDTVTSQRYGETKAVLDSFASNPTIPSLYFYGPDHPLIWWRDSELQEALAHVRLAWGSSADVIIYTGIDYWLDAAHVLTGLMLEPCP